MNVTIKAFKVAAIAVDKFGSLTAFANVLGISRQGLYMRISCGKCRYKNALQIAEVLGVDLQEIVEEEIR